jgi:hypothetical protein
MHGMWRSAGFLDEYLQKCLSTFLRYRQTHRRWEGSAY